jgi:hypothetical protein
MQQDETEPALDTTPRDLLRREVQRAWPQAQSHWSRFLLLADPQLDAQALGIAQIHLGTRQVSLNDEMILKYGLSDCVEGLLAHEVGHHVRYPGTLAVEARLRMLERSLLPFEDYSLINLFTDLMINEHLGRELRQQFIRIYQAFSGAPAFHGDRGWKSDPAFLFYLAVYEGLWRLDRGVLMGNAEPEFAGYFPAYRAESQLLAQDLFAMEPNVYTQFLYFVSVLCRYLKPIKAELPQAVAARCGVGQPSAEDWADALVPTAAEQDAIRRAINEGWFAPDQAKRLDDLNKLEERIASLPGFGTEAAQLVPEVMAAYYRQQAERFLFRPPPQRRMGEAIVPTTLDEWEQGDSIRDIDWLATLLQRGDALGGAMPLKRIPTGDYEGFDVTLWQPRVEIYLDVSGSMPDPRRALNAMTLAAQILTLGTTRAGGWVRAVLYSSEPVLYWQWCRSEVEISRFLMHYIGSGTDYPFRLLSRSVDECGADQPIRVLITDRDFDANYDAAPDNARIFAEAARRSPHFIMLLHCPRPERVRHYRSQGATVVEVPDLNDFPRLTAELTLALFPQESRDSNVAV